MSANGGGGRSFKKCSGNQFLGGGYLKIVLGGRGKNQLNSDEQYTIMGNHRRNLKSRKASKEILGVVSWK